MSTGNSYMSNVRMLQNDLYYCSKKCYETMCSSVSSNVKFKASMNFWQIFNKFALSDVAMVSVAANMFANEMQEEKQNNAFAKWVVDLISKNPSKNKVLKRWKQADVRQTLKAFNNNEIWISL